MITGETVDLSEYLDFGFYDWVYYRSGGGIGHNHLGRWLGVAHRIGNIMSYFVIDKRGEIYCTSTVGGVPNLDLQKPEMVKLTQEFDTALALRLNDEKHEVSHSDEVPDNTPNSWRQLWSDHDPDYNDLVEEQLNDESIPEADEIDHTPSTVGDPYVGMEVLLKSRIDSREAEAAEALAKVVSRKRDPDGKPKGTANSNPILDSREYVVEFPDGHHETLAANVIAESLFASCDENGQRHVLLDEITDYRRLSSALNNEEAFTVMPNGSQKRKKTTQGWEFLHLWKDGSSNWVPLKDAKNAHPVQVAEFAIANKISKEPAFAWWVPHVIKKRNRIIAKVKARYWLKSHKFGFELPKSVEHALKIDKANGNNDWQHAIEEEMKNVFPAFKEWDKPLTEMLPGYSQIYLHMIFDIKLGENFRKKARLVAGGHLTEVDTKLTHSSVVGRDSVRIAFTLAALNGLSLESCDIMNAYITAPCREKRFIVAGKEFGDEAGKIFLVVRALYGLKSAGGAFWALMRSVLRQMSFVPSKADPDIWMRPGTKEDGTEYYQYIVAYVDDMIAIAEHAKAVLRELEKHFKFKKDKIEPPTDFLGAEVKHRTVPCDDTTMAWSMEGKKYITNSIINVEQNLAKRYLPKLPTKAPNPFPTNYRPETDSTAELNCEDANWYQELIGILRWAIELGRIDIMFEVTALSSSLAMPRQGHLDAALHVFAYLKKDPSRWLLMDPTLPGEFQGTSPWIDSDWTDFYPDAKEELPPDMPKPRGKYVTITCFVDADHASNRLTRRSHTGIIILVNKAPVVWYSKRQNTVESSSFGSEFIAMRIAIDLIQALRYKLRMFGVPLGPNSDLPLAADVFCDNQSVVTNSSDALSKLNKKHNSIAFHRVRESCAGGWIRIAKVGSENNWADVLTKSLGKPARDHLIDQFMY